MTPYGFSDALVSVVADGEYHDVVQRLARRSRWRFVANVFIVDPTPGRDPLLKVDGILWDMSLAFLRGVDVRLMIGGSRSNRQIAEATIMAHWRARQLGIPTRLLAFHPKLSSHSKVVVSDTVTLAGSHNWSGGAFSGSQVQDSILITSADAAAFFASRFDRQWGAAKRPSHHV